MTDPVLDALLNRRETLEQVLSRIDVWLLVFGILVVIGVGGESIFGIRAWWNNRKLQSIQREIDAQKTRLAQKESEAFSAAIAAATQRAAEAEARAAEANLALAQFKAPRTITPQQRDRVVEAIRQFPRTPFDISSNTDSESVDFAVEIENLLLAAGWEEVDIGGTIKMEREGKKPFGLVVLTGLTIGINQSRLPDLLKPIDALVGALRKEGFETKGQATMIGNNPNAIHVRVGKKP
jgi:hypothetical protein